MENVEHNRLKKVFALKVEAKRLKTVDAKVKLCKEKEDDQLKKTQSYEEKLKLVSMALKECYVKVRWDDEVLTLACVNREEEKKVQKE